MINKTLPQRPRWSLARNRLCLTTFTWLSCASFAVAQLAGQSPVTKPSDAKPAATSNRFVPSVYRTFAAWKAACDPLPSNRSLKGDPPPKDKLPLKTFAQFAEVLNAFFRVAQSSRLAEDSAWLEKPPIKPDFFNTNAVYFLRPPIAFQPFVQRELVSPGVTLFFHGDLHGDIHSLVGWVDWLNRNEYLRDFHLVRPDVYLVFLGDYTDRGNYGIEVLYTMLRLKLENPDRVLMVRGNHEDVSLAARYGFVAEGRAKYGREFDPKMVMRLYDFLPLVLYLGCGDNVLQCNHGGMEPGFNPAGLLDAPEPIQYQLLGQLNQQRFLKDHPEMAQGLPTAAKRLMQKSLLDFQPDSPTSPSVIGFMWNDFSVVRGEPQFDFDPGRAFVYGESTTKLILKESSGQARRIQAVFRAHQHATIMNGMMRRLMAGHGVYRHWQETDSLGLLEADPSVLAGKIETGPERAIPPSSVWTFNVAPDSVYGDACGFAFDTFGILTPAAKFEDWKLKVVNQTIRR